MKPLITIATVGEYRADLKEMVPAYILTIGFKQRTYYSMGEVFVAIEEALR